MHKKGIRAITTRHKGFAFRSRLEARWAIFFDHLKIRWEYEPEGFELGNGLRYLPDFWLPDWNMWVEIKPDAPDAVTIEKASRLAEQGRYPVFVSNGMPLSGGTLFAAPVGREMISGTCEVDWGASDGKFIWLFSDRFARDKMLYSWGGAEVLTLPLAQSERSDWYNYPADEALNAARAARFEFGAKGGV